VITRKLRGLRLFFRAFFERQCVSFIKEYSRVPKSEYPKMRYAWFKFCAKVEYRLRKKRK
jgi:hypothetical protein